MNHENHSQTALDFLTASDEEFAAGDHLQASEKLWGAASHAVMAVADQRCWECRSHRAMKNAVVRIGEEVDDIFFAASFGLAEKFHKNFYHDEMEDFEIEADRPAVHAFVHRMLTYLQPSK